VLAAMAGAAVLAAAPAAVASPAQQLRFRTINVPGAAATELLAINDFGVLAGGYQDATGWHAFIKTARHITRFSYPRSSYTIASSIDDQGTASGWYQRSDGSYAGLVRSPAGQLTPLSDPRAGTGANQGTIATAVNDRGTVVGLYITSANIEHGFVYRSGRFATVDVPGGFYGKPGWGSYINDLNNAGVMVGEYTPSNDNVVEGYVETPGRHYFSFTAPGAGTRPGYRTEPESISGTGVIAGDTLGPSGIYHGWALSGFRYTPINDPLATTIPAKGRNGGTFPTVINRHGVLVGTYFDARHVEHGFLVRTGLTQAATIPRTPPATPRSRS
jgi:hypothetical protein